MSCPTPTELSESRIDRVLTQYRESPNLLFMLRTYLDKIAEAHLQICDLPEKLDLDTAAGDQLTLLGKRMGFPRSHCVCDAEPVFGFECDDEISFRPVVGFGGKVENRFFGFCDDVTTAGFGQPYSVTWIGCEVDTDAGADCAQESTWEVCSSGLSIVTLSDDEVYRRFLKVRRYQYLRMFDLASLETSLQLFFGTAAKVLAAGQGRVVITPGRSLSTYEISLLQLFPRVLPLAPGVIAKFHFGETRVFGFGEGWGGVCEPLPISADSKSGVIFGFNCEGDETYGGFCETWVEGAEIATSADDILVTETNDEIITGRLLVNADWQCTQGSPWMCEIDVQPYNC
jgi:hypothetical protein